MKSAWMLLWFRYFAGALISHPLDWFTIAIMGMWACRLARLFGLWAKRYCTDNNLSSKSILRWCKLVECPHDWLAASYILCQEFIIFMTILARYLIEMGSSKWLNNLWSQSFSTNSIFITLLLLTTSFFYSLFRPFHFVANESNCVLFLCTI